MIIVTGQTATGKTALALEYAKKYNGELISFDSRQIYKYLDIITGKDKNLISGGTDSVRLWLYDIVAPNQYFSSYNFVQLAVKTINNIQKREKTPILVGGAYLYLKHFLYGFDYKVPPDFKLREKLNNKPIDYLQKYLISLNTEVFKKLNNSDQYNPRRLIRKIEIEKYRQKHNKKIQILPTPPPIFPVYPTQQFIGLKFKDKAKLVQTIERRVGERLKNGAIDEVKKILKMGYKKTDPGLKTIGYKELIEHCEGKVSLEKAVDNWISSEIQYAKRQYAFMKKDPNISWKTV